jgi:hypothetical protein
MNEFFSINIGQIGQAIVILVGVAAMFQALRSDVKDQGFRISKLENAVEKTQDMMILLARQEERYAAMDQRMMAQGARIDSTANILNGRLEAINNIISGHTSQLNHLNSSSRQKQT